MTGEKRQPPGYSFQTDNYDLFQVIYVLAGRLYFRSGGKEVGLLPHQALVLGPGSAFRLSCRADGYEGVCYLTTAAVGVPVHGQARAVRADATLRQLARLVARELSAPGAVAEPLRESLGAALAWQTVRLGRVGAGLPAEPEQYRRYWCELIGQALAASLYARRNPTEALAGLNLSYRQLARYLKEETGLSPKQYQTALRLEEARRLLRETDLPVTSIAYELGFSSSQHFAGLLRARLGLSPTAYRSADQKIRAKRTRIIAT